MFSRALNIPARYVVGYLPDIGVPVSPEPSTPVAATRSTSP
jgi:transglutaminase-like putative cysteine protease